MVGLHDGLGVNLESLTVWQIVARAVIIYLAGVLSRSGRRPPLPGQERRL